MDELPVLGVLQELDTDAAHEHEADDEASEDVDVVRRVTGKPLTNPESLLLESKNKDNVSDN